jgi:hypothetical protein
VTADHAAHGDGTARRGVIAAKSSLAGRAAPLYAIALNSL